MANEKRLIDANACPALFDEKYKATRQLINQGETHLDNLAEGFTEADRVIQGMPTVDAVEVVRCKDCKNYDNSEGICWCNLNSKFYPGGFDWHSFPEDGFCSYGERRTDG